MSALVFHGKSLKFVLDEGNVEHVPVKWLAAMFGLNAEIQRQRLQSAAWARTSKILVVAKDGKKRLTPCIPLRRVGMFFATLHASSVPETMRAEFVAWQDGIADAIDDFLRNGGAVNPAASMPQLLALQAEINRIMRDTPTNETLWPDEFTKQVCRLNGEYWKPGMRQPLWMQNPNGFVYTMLFTPDVCAVIKARGLAAGVEYHRNLTDAPRGYMRHEMEKMAAIAENAKTISDWKRRCERHYGKTATLQLDGVS